ncbi:hypothetical protein F3D53_31320, partial [Bacteroides ovatus]
MRVERLTHGQGTVRQRLAGTLHAAIRRTAAGSAFHYHGGSGGNASSVHSRIRKGLGRHGLVLSRRPGSGRRGGSLHPGDAAQEEKEEAQGLGNVISQTKYQQSKQFQGMSQQEDDLRALAKIMDFLRAVSIIL